MTKLGVSYLDLELKSPIIVSSSGLTDSVTKVVELNKIGAGAVVLKSLFEEQIRFEAGSMLSDNQYPEAEDYITNYVKNNKVEEYLQFIEKSKKETDFPIIASINCVASGEWISFAKSIQEAGADALELNIYALPTDLNKSSDKLEQSYYDIVDDVRKVTDIPLSIKIGQNISHLPNFVSNLYQRGANGVVMFNRFYAPDIDLKKIGFTPADVFSTPQEIRNSLRWVGIISALVDKVTICASTGVHDGNGVIKQILAGADAVQVCSALYKNGGDFIQQMHNDILDWMDKNTFDSIRQFKGRLNYKRIGDPSVFERSQFMKYYSDKNK